MTQITYEPLHKRQADAWLKQWEAQGLRELLDAIQRRLSALEARTDPAPPAADIPMPVKRKPGRKPSSGIPAYVAKIMCSCIHKEKVRAFKQNQEMDQARVIAQFRIKLPTRDADAVFAAVRPEWDKANESRMLLQTLASKIGKPTTMSIAESRMDQDASQTSG